MFTTCERGVDNTRGAVAAETVLAGVHGVHGVSIGRCAGHVGAEHGNHRAQVARIHGGLCLDEVQQRPSLLVLLLIRGETNTVIRMLRPPRNSMMK